MTRCKIKSEVAFLVIIFSFFSCNKYLDKKSDKRLVELSSLADLQAMLDNNDYMNAYTPGLGETSADDYFVLMTDYNTFVDFEKAAYTWGKGEYTYPNDWSYNYRGVYPANYCLDYVEKIPRDLKNAKEWDNVKGAALFFRAYRYLGLIWEYGKAYDESQSSSDLGIFLRLSSDPSEKSLRASVKECYNQIVTDAMESVNLLGTSEHVMRPSKAAAFGLLARTYLSMRKYDSAFKYSNLTLQLRNELQNFNNPDDIDSMSMTPFKLFNREIIFFSTQSGNYFPKSASIALIDTVLYSSFKDNDLRKSTYFFDMQGNGYKTFKGNYNSSDFFTNFSGIATDEMYLIRSECYIRLSKMAEGLDDLNTLLKNRYAVPFVPLVAADEQEALKLVLQERRKELIRRGIRWSDIKRLNKEGRAIVLTRVADRAYTLPPNDDRYALPLPRDIIELTGVEQN